MDKTKAQVSTVSVTRNDIRTLIASQTMSDEEERYMRIRFGISEPTSAPITRRGQEFPETRAKLAYIEASMVADMVPSGESNPIKARIIERLREL